MFNRLSIRQKLTAMLMIMSSAVLLMASAAFVTWDFYRFRAEMEVDLETKAGLVLENTAAAITFKDPEAARETLEMLSIDPHVQIACLYLPDGSLFVHTNFHDTTQDRCPARVTAGTRQFTANRLQITRQLDRGLDRGSTVFIASDLDAHRARLRTQTTAVAAILVAGWFVSLLLSTLLQQIVAKPIAALAGTARSIADRGDYSIRASSHSQDEIGVLVQAFNRMLDEIQAAERERAALLEREQQANRLKDEFLATLSHELRTPLNAIVGWVHLLRRGQLPAEEVTHALERIDRNAHAQARLVQDLLDVSRITTGKLMLDIREMDLTVVAANALDACRPAADARQVNLVCDCHTPMPTMGDPDRLQQVMWNLISNAVRFTPAGGTVTVSLTRANDMDTIEVRDTGSGIEPQFLPFMFEPFRQADAASTRAHGGLGIGLTIVRRLTEMHGGTVSVSSEGLGTGATLTVTLPVRRSTAKPAPFVAERRSRPRSLAHATVLVVEDDPDTLEMLASTLGMAGANPITARSVAEAVRIIDGTTLDAMVSDIAMPGQDGYTLMTLLRDRLGDAMPAATVALTAYASRADRDRALAAGFREHLAKPVNPDVLLQTLEDLLAEGANSPA
ncbi:MAG TPA: ATP-binding protein [Vicinamibacterales bacterium]|nr:ATP-binding protein [Vicinamibacterales bacterium]